MKHITRHIIYLLSIIWVFSSVVYAQDATTSSIPIVETDTLSPVARKAQEKQAAAILKNRKKEEKRLQALKRREDIAARRAALIAQEDSLRIAATKETPDTLSAHPETPVHTTSYMDVTDTLLMPNMEYFALDDSTMMAEGKILKAPPAKKEKNAAHAAFLSALLPGAGQIYGGTQWWMAPVFWGGMAGTLCAVSWYNTYYNDFRAEYKYRIATGEMKDYTYFSNEALVDRMQQAEQQRDLWIIGTVGVYLLNILHANVAVQLSEFKVQKKHREAIEREEIMKTLTLAPVMMSPAPGLYQNPTPGIGLTFSF